MAVTVVNAPVVAVVAPTVPLMLIDAVPVRLVTVPLLGVPKAPPLTTKAPAEPVLTPRAVTTPVPVVIVLGAVPAPPPTTIAFAAKAALDAQADALVKYGTPPLVPATVNAGVVVAVATEIMPPVKLTLVTVPLDPPLAAMLMPPAELVMLIPDPAVNVANEYPVPFPIGSWPSVGVADSAVPPFATATVPVREEAEIVLLVSVWVPVRVTTVLSIEIVPVEVIGPPVKPVPVAIDVTPEPAARLDHALLM